MRDYPRPFIDFSKQHQAIGPTTFDPPHMMIRRLQPPPGFDNDRQSSPINGYRGGCLAHGFVLGEHHRPLFIPPFPVSGRTETRRNDWRC